ncbi:MAG: hypothetical protein AB1640_01860 [bacterium]
MQRPRSRSSSREIGLKVGRVLHRYKMGKHFRLRIREGAFSYQRRQETIERERQLDGIYVIRTSEPTARMSSEDVVSERSICRSRH